MRGRKRERGIVWKIVGTIIVFVLLLCLSISYAGYRQFTEVLEQRYNDSAYEIAEIAKSYINGDKINEYVETGKTDEEYWETAEKLNTLVDKGDATFIYVAKIDTSDYLTSTYVFDAVNSKLGYDIYELGYTSKDMDEKYVHNIKKVMTTGERVTEYCYSYSKEYGDHTTAGVAIYNSKGEAVAFLGVEKAMTILTNARKTYVVHTIEIIAGAAVIFVLGMIVFLNKELIAPIRLMEEEAAKFVQSKATTSEALGEIKKKDEVGSLARSLLKMEQDTVTYIRNLTEITAEKERIGAELGVAKKIQAEMLPCIFPAFPDRKEFDIYASMNPAKEVGGDFYDFFLVDDNHLAAVMADVSGKGVPAALFMVIAKTLIKNAVQQGLSPKEVLEKVNHQLCENNEEEMFVTVWLGILELSTGRMICANAGHEYPAICRKGGEYELFRDKHGFVLAGMDGSRYKEYEITLHRGDRIYLYTDGVVEAVNVSHELFGTKRMTQALNKEKDSTPQEVLERVKQEVMDFAGDMPQFDDITMMEIYYLGTEEKKMTTSADRDHLGEVHRFIRDSWGKDFDEKRMQQLMIAVEEIFVNICSYAYPEKEGTVTVSFAEREDAQIELTFTDEGLPYNPLEKEDPDITLDAEKRNIGGLGIFMVKKMMDEVCYRYEEGKNHLTIRKRVCEGKTRCLDKNNGK